MDKQRIADLLKQLRKTSGMTAGNVSDRLKEYGFCISPKTISGYENARSTPDANIFMVLCDIYRCDNPMALFGHSSLSQEESKFIEAYRSLDDHGKTIVNLVLQEEFDRCSTTKPKTRLYPYYRKIAAAGTGVYMDDIPSEMMEVPEIHGADFLIGVNGDSMEPTFYDGDIVYVRQTKEINVGQIGIFFHDGECFIKECGTDGLISHNSKYPTIKGNDTTRCAGIVLGKV